MNCAMEKDAEATIREWLKQYKSLAETAVADYAKEILGKESILRALMELFRACTNAGASDYSSNTLLQPVCHQLFEFYRSGHRELKLFTLNLLPSITLSHIIISSGSLETTPSDTLILSIFSLENAKINEDNSLGIEIPQLHFPSVYHEPMSGVFSEQSVKDRGSGRRYYHKPYMPDYKDILPSNRFQILSRVLTVYCEHIPLLKRISHLSLCEACTYLASCGYLWQDLYLPQNGGYEPIKRRIVLGVEFIMILLRGVYFAMYNHCYHEGHTAVEVMHTRASVELLPQPIFLCNAILDDAKMEEARKNDSESFIRPDEEIPYGLSSIHLTPMLTRENSRRAKSRNAATAKSIRDHKWSHRSEEISGDLSRSLQNPEIHVHPPKSSLPPTSEAEERESGKLEKHTTSPSKLLKSKLKKSVPVGSPSGATEKSRSPAPSGDKKYKKLQSDKSQDDGEEKQKSSPTLKRTPSKKSPQLTKRTSKSSIQKQHSLDDAKVHATSPKAKMPVSKSTNDSISPVPPPGKGLQGSASLENSYNPNETSSPKHANSTSPLLEISKQLDTSTDSDSPDLSTVERSKETYPLLPTGDQPATKHHNGTQQTLF